MQHVRYVILRHEGVAVSHFDVMFEAEPMGKLHTWRSLDWPIKQETRLTRLDDHRRDYLEYEGPLSSNRGYVKRVQSGVCDVDWPNRYECIVQFDDPAAPALQLRQVSDREWLATPV